ncbi:acyltransferase-domain-containing protein [Basidiobolus meristosporus CBS 931.73]|uniref:Acyltransferase-domain-containing protein n=1 Tax=Basidiobolus meristosporus CBS 931.73 TaxID=1314790 RepID=A0A1Y1Z5J0_9FUNG|nr:acyltransferase-domain-containing protein [Basidiobolus meristosporus CBS 931.73]|eukprot:ORY05523.1 acyltransferase-domain-containing protein [Basidiobolus meristosporus CBS 931.73]
MAFVDEFKSAPRTAAFVVFFLGQAAIINFSQILSSILRPFSNVLYERFISYSQRLFGILLVAITELFAPSSFVISADPEAADILKNPTSASLPLLSFPDRIILIANHQIYADWIYLWCIAYFAKAHGAIKIILKDTLKHIPIFGWGMQFFDFIFLKRSWATDQAHLTQHLNRLSRSVDPLWLILFPEGTVISDCTRKKSNAFAAKEKIYTPKNVLLPRSTGMHFCCSQLRKSVNYVYDLTVGYEGLKQDHIPQIEYTLKSMYFLSKYPRQIHVHVRRFDMNDIPADDTEFSHWIRERWQEKDQLMEHFYKNGCFPATDHMKVIDIKMNHFSDLGQIWLLSIPLIIVSCTIWYFVRNYIF